MTNSNRLWTRLGKPFSEALSFCLLFFVAAYRTIGTTFLGGACRYEPSCSQYAVDCIHTYHPLKALKMMTQRVLRCRPGGGFGYDPVVPNKKVGK